uniref:Peptidase aspartic putative domain-containing protein n=1 Tax=Anopheles albimanus TaxID=7167 RepID=A0A182FND9_ANOAL
MNERPRLCSTAVGQPETSTTRGHGYPNPTNNWSQESGEEFHLSRSQAAARKGLQKDLPPFKGDPEDWPRYITLYRQTTRMCGYTDEENTVRLQASLRGKALESVKCLLMHPHNLRRAIETLETRYGQPEAIIYAMIAKLHALPAVDEKRLESILDLETSVSNLCATAEACGLSDQLYDLTLMGQLQRKLPSSLIIKWAEHKLERPQPVSVIDFSKWLSRLARALCSVTPSLQNREKLETDRQATKPTRPTQVWAMTHEAAGNEKGAQPNSGKHHQVCVACQRDCDSLAKCEKFKEMTVPARWELARAHKRCYGCLKRFYGSCRTGRCTIEACPKKHHTLLHRDVAPKPESVDVLTHSASQGCGGLRLVPVLLMGEAGTPVATFALLDEGSQLTLMDQELANELKLQGPEKSLCLLWTGGAQRTEDLSQEVRVRVAGHMPGAKSYELAGYVGVEEIRKELTEYSEISMYERSVNSKVLY